MDNNIDSEKVTDIPQDDATNFCKNNMKKIDEEQLRLNEDSLREANWKRWGPYLSERQWGTVREDYSHDGNW